MNTGSNIEKYIENVFLDNSIPNDKEEESVILEFLNHERIHLSQKLSIIEKYDFVIDELSEYEVDLYPALLQSNKVNPTWKNIFVAYEQEKFSDELKQYLISQAKNINGNLDWHNGIAEDLFFDIANSDISVESYDLILESVNETFNLYADYENSEKLVVLISKNKIRYHSDDWKLLARMPAVLLKYVTHYKGEIVASFDDFFDLTDVNQESLSEHYRSVENLVFNDNIHIDLKAKLFAKFANKIEIAGNERKLYENVRNSGLTLPSITLNKFKDSDLSDVEKQFLATKTHDLDKNSELLSEYLQTFMKELRGIKGEFRMTKYPENFDKVMRLYADVEENRVRFSYGRNRKGYQEENRKHIIIKPIQVQDVS